MHVKSFFSVVFASLEQKAKVFCKKHGRGELSTSFLALHLHYICLLCSGAQSVGLNMVIKSRLCNWHRGVGCGWIHLPGAWGHDTDVPGSLSSAVSDRRRQLTDAFHVGITACSDRETKTSVRLCGKIQLWVFWSLNVSLKVNFCPKFISSDNIFVRRNEQLCFQSCPQGHSIDNG